VLSYKVGFTEMGEMINTKNVFLLAAGLVLSGTELKSAEVLVGPAYIKVFNVEIGQNNELAGPDGYLLQIANKTDQAAVFEVSFFSCLEMQKDPFWGYADIPNSDWIVPKSAEVVVPPNSVANLTGQHIVIPKDRLYYGKRWHAMVRITQKNKRATTFNIEWLLPLLIETQKEKK